MDFKAQTPLSWDQYFMGIAMLSAMRSKDPVTKVGACIAGSNNHVLALGYNGMPRGCDDGKMPWEKVADDVLNTKYPYVCHAELNAILNSGGRVLLNSYLYTTLFPCCECAKAIIQVGIKKIIYYKIKNEFESSVVASKKMFKMTGISFEKYNKKNVKIEVDL